jgi:threonine/homoserine/homoserine lactone efflux protein
MFVDLYFKGLLTGLILSLPFGPMGILVIQRTANRDFKSGYFSAMGVAITDSTWALIAGFSVSYIITFLREHQTVIQLIGASAVFLLGLYIFNSHPLKAIRKNRIKATSPTRYFFASIAFALSNPAMVLAYIVVFAGFNIVFDIYHLSSPIFFIAGFLTGAMSWWTLIVYLVDRFRHHFNLHILWWFNKIAGIFIMLFVVVSMIWVLTKGNPAI